MWTSEQQEVDELPRPSTSLGRNRKVIIQFPGGYHPEKIVEADINKSGEMIFKMKWKGRTHIDQVLANDANIICPQHVIKFYEERTVWRTCFHGKTYLTTVLDGNP